MFQSVLKPFVITPGVPFTYPFTYYQGPPTTYATVDMTGASSKLVITDGLNNVLLTLLSSSSSAQSPPTGIYFGGQQQTPTNGIVTLVIDAPTTTAITWKYAKYDLTLTTNIFGLQRLMYGSFAISGSLP